MRFKTHSSVGDLMFREFDSLDELHAALEAHREKLPFTQLVVMHEDTTTQSGWDILASSTHVIDFVPPNDKPAFYGSWESNNVSEISGALARGAFVRWRLFCDDEPLDQCLQINIGLHGTQCQCPIHKGVNMEEKVVSLEEGQVAIVLTEGPLAVNVEHREGRLVILVLREDEDGNWKEIGRLLAKEND